MAQSAASSQPAPTSNSSNKSPATQNPLITLKRYGHLLDERLTDAAANFDPAEKHPDPR
jgi:hypothetical protein